MQSVAFKKQIKKAPKTAGVYFFKSSTGNILYIGKAKDLHARLTSYASAGDDNLKAEQLIEQAALIEWVDAASELDAMLLEATLIRQHKPPFNVLLKEGNPFLYFFISQDDPPRFSIERIKKKKGAYFGPFVDKRSTRKLFSFLQKKFRLKLCNKKIANGCIDYHLGICAGSCLPRFDITAYNKRLSFVKKFLTNGYESCRKVLEKELQASNKALTFEYSQELVLIIEALQSFSTMVSSTALVSTDAALYQVIDLWIFNEEALLLTYYQEEQGVLQAIASWYVDNAQTFEEEYSLLQEYMLSYYREHQSHTVILTNFELKDLSLFTEFLEIWHKHTQKITVQYPHKGHYGQLVSLAQLQQKKKFLDRSDAALQIQKWAGLKKPPLTIDCFDISHMQGTVVVGVSVRFANGIPDTQKTRYFIIKSFEGNNDYAALQEVVGRRYREEKDYPDLIVIDGGKGQRSAVKKVCTQIPLASLAKKEERFFTDRHSDGIILDYKEAAGQLLIALRDYCHKTAVQFHRKRSKKERLLQ